MKATQRTFTDVETGHKCRLYTSADASRYHLIYEGQHQQIADGSEVNGFYIAAQTGATIRLNTKKELYVSNGQFYHLKEGEQVTHRKFIGFTKFSRI